MNIDVANAVQELLYENQSVVIPGFGGFTSTYKSAAVDFVQGAVAPPAKNITFNPNLKINDGVMVAFLQKKHAISVEEAQAAITQ
ncbi:MAG: nucleoid DNA-binding protein, partial [Paraglaciecola sp.]